MRVVLHRLDADGTAVEIARIVLNADGRADAPLLQGDALVAGRYRLVFGVAAYFAARGTVLPEPPSSARCRSISASPRPRSTTTCPC